MHAHNAAKLVSFAGPKGAGLERTKNIYDRVQPRHERGSLKQRVVSRCAVEFDCPTIIPRSRSGYGSMRMLQHQTFALPGTYPRLPTCWSRHTRLMAGASRNRCDGV